MGVLIRNFEEIVSGAFIVTMVCVVIANVLLRFFFGYSIYWAEEVATICFVWSVFMGASATYKHKMDIGIDIIVNKLPELGQAFMRGLVSSLLLIINGYIFYMSINFTVDAFQKPTAVLGVSSAVMNSALIVSFGLISVHTLRHCQEGLRSQKSGGQR